MKCISVKNPLSYLICAGIKDVENRTWKTNHRGRLYIHSSGQGPFADLYEQDFPIKVRKALRDVETKENVAIIPESPMKPLLGKIYDLIIYSNRLSEKKEPLYLSQAIVGHVDLVDIVKDSDSVFAEPGQYHWKLQNAVLYKNPVLFVRGKLKIFDIDFEQPKGYIKI